MTAERRDPTTLPGRPCSVAAALDVIGDRWSLLVVREVLLGNHRFTEIARNTGAPRDRLSARLRDLVAAGVLEQRPLPDPPHRDGYYLTRAGRDLGPVIRELLAWGDRWAVTTPPMRLVHHDHPLAATTVCTTCGEPVKDRAVRREMTVGDWTLAGAEGPAATSAG